LQPLNFPYFKHHISFILKQKLLDYLKNNPLWEIIGLLIISFAIIGAYSFAQIDLKIPEIALKKTEINQLFESVADSSKNVLKQNLLADTDTIIKEIKIKIDTIKKANKTEIRIDTVFKIDTLSKQEYMSRLDTTKQRILIIGDSMLENLRFRLRDYCEENGHEMKSVIWYSSTTEYFGQSDTLAYFIKQYNPTYILFVVGANELFVKDIKKKRQKYVEHILAQIGNRKFIWIGPPNWKEDTGINEMIVENVGEKRYYPSLKLKYKRHKDGAHPLKASAYAWMDSVATWITTQSMYPIVLNKPTKTSKGSTNTTMLQPRRN